MPKVRSHALWLAIRGFVFYKFLPNIRAHDNYVGEVHSAVDNFMFNRRYRGPGAGEYEYDKLTLRNT